MDFAIGGIVITALIIGIVEAAKEFGVTGKWSRLLALVVGIVLTGLAYAIQRGVIPDPAVLWVEIVVTAIAGGVAAMGYYDLVKKFATGGAK